MCVWGWGLGAYETLGHFWVGYAELHLVCCSILEKKLDLQVIPEKGSEKCE